MDREQLVQKGEIWFYDIIRSQSLTIKEKVVKIRLHEKFGYHNDTYLFLDVIGESGECMWRYPNNAPIDYPLEKMQALGEYLSDLFSCPLEEKLI